MCEVAFGLACWRLTWSSVGKVCPNVETEARDHIWCAKYLLEGDANGAGCHTNYSTRAMREDGGFEVIKKVILNLSLRHTEHNSSYGEGNERRLARKHDSASINQFSWGVANRDCSIRGGVTQRRQAKRPTSNMDPYIVTGLLAETTIPWEPTLVAEPLATQKLALNV
ncbi:putative glutamine synthetase [Helianthus annuus]|nr:putative glutamine synthetase [Helianthus annuus]